MDAYGLLGVPRNATADTIRNAYKEKAMLNHPDRGGDPTIWANMQKAYDTLSDPQRRAMYDKQHDTSGSAEKQFAQSFTDNVAEGGPRKTVNISNAVSAFCHWVLAHKLLQHRLPASFLPS